MRRVTFQRIYSETERVYQEPLRRRKTWKKISLVLREMHAAGLKTSADIGPSLIARWIQQNPRRPATAYSLLRSFRAVCSLAKSSGWIEADPFDWRKPAAWLPSDGPFDEPAEPRGRCRSAEEIARLFALLDKEAESGDWRAQRLRALVYTYAYLGLRKTEALGLHREDFDLVSATVTIRSRRLRRLKTRGSAATLALPEPLAQVLRPWLARCGSEWVFPGATKRGPWMGGPPGRKPLCEVKAAGLRAGISGLTILDFRHTFGTLADAWGMGQLELMRWLRHDKPTTQAWYRKTADVASLRETARKINFKVV